VLPSCGRPRGWCSHAGAVFEMKDCDGDGIPEPTCKDKVGNFGARLTGSKCKDTWPRGTCNPKPPPPPAVKPAFLGCYRDDGARDFCCGPKRYGYNQEKCAKACSNFEYFALQHNGWCTCDNTYSTPASKYPKTPESDCGANKLGGGWRNSVYRTKGPAPKSTLVKPDGYFGCFVDDGPRDFCCGPKRYGYDANKCRKECNDGKFKYFALQNGGWCTCDNSFSTPKSRYPKKSDAECGGPSSNGRGWRNSVYVVDKTPSAKSLEWYTGPAVECPAGFKQVGDLGADIGGCGLESCGARYGPQSYTPTACSQHCKANSRCKGFNWAPMNGDRNHAGTAVCTIYTENAPRSKWMGVSGKPMQIFCAKA